MTGKTDAMPLKGMPVLLKEALLRVMSMVWFFARCWATIVCFTPLTKIYQMWDLTKIVDLS